MTVLKYKDPSTGNWVALPGQGGGGGGGGITVEQAVDAVAAALVEGANIDIVYDDTANTITISASGGGGGGGVPAGGAVGQILGKTGSADYAVGWVADQIGAGGGIDAEGAVDAVAAALGSGGNNIDITYNDGAGTITIDVEALTIADIASLQAALDAKVATTRTITTTAPLTGGGDLSANRTLDISTFTTTVKGAVPPPVTVTGKFLKDDGTWDAASGGGGAPVRRTVNAQTGTTYAPVVADENTMVTLSNAAAVTVTMPSNATQAFPVGAEVDFMWLGVGQPTFAAGSGATVNATPGLKLRGRYSAATAKKIGTDAWVIIGDLAT